MKTIFTLLFILSFSLTMNAQKTEIIEAIGLFKEIDVKKQNQAISVLFTGNETMKGQMLDIFSKNPGKWNPPVLYSVSSVLFDFGYKDEAALWFYVAQLRARYDANRCQDKSARSAVAILNDKFGVKINTYALQDLKKLKTIVDNAIKIVQYDAVTYDHRWINLHGMWAINGIEKGKTLSFPKEEWEAIKKKTIADYSAGFEKHVLNKK